MATLPASVSPVDGFTAIDWVHGSSAPVGTARSPDRAMWRAEYPSNRIGRLIRSGDLARTRSLSQTSFNCWTLVSHEVVQSLRTDVHQPC